MASALNRKPCVKCPKALGHALCNGCQQIFCTKHFMEHRQNITTEVDHVVEMHDLLKHQLNNDNIIHQSLLDRINAWEKKAIRKIQAVAEQARLDLGQSLSDVQNRLKTPLEALAKEIQIHRETDDYTETEIKGWLGQLHTMRQQLQDLSDFDLLHDQGDMDLSISIIKFAKNIRRKLARKLNVGSRWKPNGVTVAGGHGHGNALNQLHLPYGFDVDDDGTVFVADNKNNRIVEWKVGTTVGEIIVGQNGQGNRLDQLNHPTDVIVDRATQSLIIGDWGNQRVIRWSLSQLQSGEILVSDVHSHGLALDDAGDLYVCDWDRHEVLRYRRGENNGIIVAGGNGQGNGLHQLNCPYGVFVDEDCSVYVSDRGNHRVVKWVKGAEEGVVVAGGQGSGRALNQLMFPSGLYVDVMGSVYVVDSGNHRVTRWLKGAKEGTLVIGGNDPGVQSNQIAGPFGLRFDGEGSLFVADYHNHRVQKFLLE